MPKTRLLFIAVVLALLGVAIGLVVYGSTRPLTPTFHGRLADLMPPAPPGWTRTEQPIADSPEMIKAVGETLSYDDGAFFVYTSGPLRLSVYAAYWQPGKMSARLVAGHTPDVCWVGAGWTCTARDEVSNYLEANPGTGAYRLHSVPVGGTPPSRSDRLQSILPPAEARTFVAQGTTEYVWFWHLVDGHPQSYGTGREPPWHAMFTDMIGRGFEQRAEQFFIRLSSPQQLDDPVLQPVLAPVLRSLIQTTVTGDHRER